jgi:O-antigen/teichoic acid export membrane protein
VPVVQIIAVTATLTMFGSSSATLLNAIGRPSQTFYLVAISGAVRLAGLILWVPSYGLTGAAIALSVAALVDLVAFLWVTLPQIGVSLRQVIGRSIRPCIATGVMVLALWQLGMAWTPSAGTEVVQIGIDVAMRSSIGATCYAVALALCWLAAGRPDGAERHALMLAGGAWSRIRGLLRI